MKGNITARNLKEVGALAKDILGNLKKKDAATVVALSGDLGAGKTAFAKEIAGHLGIAREDVTSPTYVIEKIYPIRHPFFSHLIHIDAYRLESERELASLGWDDIVKDPRNLILIEWPEMVPGLIPEDAISMQIRVLDGEIREFTIHD